LAEVAYQDAIQPGAKELGLAAKPAGKEFGEAVTTIAKAVNMALGPLRGFIWCWEQVQDYVVEQVNERFKDKPENLVAPNAVVAVPVLQALQYTGSSPTLRDMYMNLLATAMDKDTATKAHPAFVEIIRQLTSDEARIMKRMADKTRPAPRKNVRGYAWLCDDVATESGCEVTDGSIAYVDNLCRLGLLRNAQMPKGVLMLEDPHQEREGVSITQFGINFCEACQPSSD
jgi:hypothetical protein